MIPNNPLALIRYRAGLATAREAAEKLGCSRIHLLNIERGRNGAGAGLLAKMAKLYQTDEAKIVRAILRAKKSLLERSLRSL